MFDTLSDMCWLQMDECWFFDTFSEEINTDYVGTNLTSHSNTLLSDCKYYCLENPTCVGVVHVTSNNACYLKSNLTNIYPQSRWASGINPRNTYRKHKTGCSGTRFDNSTQVHTSGSATGQESNSTTLVNTT
jgi:hypothetical protein